MGFKQSNKRKRFFQRRYLHILLHVYTLTIYSRRSEGEKIEFSDSSHKGKDESMWDCFNYLYKDNEESMESNSKS